MMSIQAIINCTDTRQLLITSLRTTCFAETSLQKGGWQLTVSDSREAFSWSVDASGYCRGLFSFLYQSSLKPLLLSTLYFDP